MPTYKNIDKSDAFKALSKAKPFDVTALTADRIATMRTDLAAGLAYSWAAAPVDNDLVDLLADLAQ